MQWINYSYLTNILFWFNKQFSFNECNEWTILIQRINLSHARSDLNFSFIGRSTLVGQRPMKSLSSICLCLPVCPTVRPFLSFLKMVSLVSSDIVHDNSWPWYLVTVGVRFLKKKLEILIWAKWSKIKPETSPKCGLLVFLEIAYNDSLQQCITSSKGKTHEKNFGGPNLG